MGIEPKPEKASLPPEAVARAEPKKERTPRWGWGSRLVMRGATAKAIQELAGHENLTTTQRYMHLTPAAKDAAISLLDTAGAQLSGDILETGSTTQGKTGG